MTDKDKDRNKSKDKDDGIISELDSKIIGYLGKKVMEDIESSLEGFISGDEKKEKKEKDVKKEEPQEEKASEKPQPEENEKTEEDDKDESIVSELDSRLKNVFGNDVVEDIENALDSFLPEKGEAISDLGAKLDDFLSGETTFGLEDKVAESEASSEKVIEDKQAKVPEATKEEIQKLSIEQQLQALKARIKPSEATQRETSSTNQNSQTPAPERPDKKTDTQVEKQFKDKEINDALSALKAKISSKKEQQPADKKAPTNPEDVTDSDIDKSLTDLLKKMDKN